MLYFFLFKFVVQIIPFFFLKWKINIYNKLWDSQ